jgi:hypothetical protein
MIILSIKEIISKNNNISLEELISKCVVGDPLISEEKAVNLLTHMRRAGMINVNEKEEVTLCR